MKVTVLVDNIDGIANISTTTNTGEEPVRGEWGLSMYIEYNGKVILLDTGLSGLFADNADKLGLDLERVNYGVLSHAHDDHANGMDTFFERNRRADFYVAPGCAENCYDRKGILYKYAGIPRGIMQRHKDRIIISGHDMYIDEGIRLLAHTTPDLDRLGCAEKMFLRQGFFRFVPDDFRHEHSLVFELPEGIAIFNSCSHAGADNIINEVMQVYPDKRILAMIGGFHLYNKTDEYVRAFSRRVGETGVQAVYTGHCTGEKALAIMKEELGDRVHALYTGLIFEV